MNLVNKVVPLAELEAEGVQWADEILEMSPTAIRFLKSAFLVATDGLAGLQEFAGNATGLYYTTDEAHEGSTAFLEKRPPDYRSTRAAREHPLMTAPPPRAGPPLGVPDLAARGPARDAARGAGRRRGRDRRGRSASGGPFRLDTAFGLRGRRAAAPGRRELRQRPVRLPPRRRHAGPARARCASPPPAS